MAGAAAVAGLVGGGLAVRGVADDGPATTAAAVAATPAASASATAKPASRPQTCAVRYALRGTAAGRASATATATATIHNTSKVTVPRWRLSFALPSGQRVIKGKPATWRQDGRAVEAAGGKLPAGGTAATSFSTTYGEVAALPVAFRLNSTTCQAQMSMQAAPPTGRRAGPGQAESRGRQAQAPRRRRGRRGRGRRRGVALSARSLPSPWSAGDAGTTARRG
uniref:cellulose binding domain-containing protein n=1 Tax=Paractinoplanes polyasparticus TaxID=2856853 RepID=UPI0034DB43EA